MRILLLSNSGRPFLEHARPHLADFLASVTPVAFVTAASLGDETAYWERARDSLSPVPPTGLGLDVLHLRWDADPLATLDRAEAVFVGGGNTYALLKRLRAAGLLAAIRSRVQAGMPYIGSSAGSNVAGPRILTTNDWNVVALDAFEALALVPFNVNPHYLETDLPWRPLARLATTASASTTRSGTMRWSASRKARCYVSRAARRWCSGQVG